MKSAKKRKPVAEAALRQELLLRLVGSGRCRTQHDLKLAFARQGIAVTQSSLSRDIKRLGLVKVRGAYAIAGSSDGRPLPPLLEIDAAGPNLLVAKTLPGLAASVAVAIDERRLPHIVGTVAGDDTVFVATAMGAKQDRIIHSLRSFFPRQA